MTDATKAGKRGLPKDDHAYDESEDEEQAASSSATTKSKHARLTTKQHDDGASTTTDLFSESLVTTAIFSYLGVRELLQLSVTSKFLRQHVSHEHVVRSALCRGGHAKTSVERIVKLVRDGSRTIWTPSPLRLLRLVNGKRCERCNQGKVNLVSADFGFFLCSGRCLPKYSKKVARNRKWRPFLDHPRIAAAGSSSDCYIATGHYREQATNALVGPKFPMPTMQQVMRGEGTIEHYVQIFDNMDDNARREEAENQGLDGSGQRHHGRELDRQPRGIFR